MFNRLQLSYPVSFDHQETIWFSSTTLPQTRYYVSLTQFIGPLKHILEDGAIFECIVFKLKENGASGTVLKFLEYYLRNRKQRVVLNISFAD